MKEVEVQMKQNSSGRAVCMQQLEQILLSYFQSISTLTAMVRKDDPAVKSLVAQVKFSTSQLESLLQLCTKQLVEIGVEVETGAKVGVEAETGEQKGRSLPAIDIEKYQREIKRLSPLVALGNKVSRFTHHLSTPINVIGINIQVMIEGIDVIKAKLATGKITAGEFKNFLDEDAVHAGQILEHIQDISEMNTAFKEEGGEYLNKEPRSFNLKEYFEKRILLIQNTMYRYTKHEIVVKCPDDLMICLPPAVLSTILTNLLENSMKHGFKNIDEGEVTIEVLVDGDDFVLNYRDNGNGMAKKTKAHFLEPGFTNGDHGGIGMGMAIVHDLVSKDLGGTMDYDSEVGKGTSFSIKIPKISKSREVR